MRTINEITQKFQEIEPDDFLGFMRSDLINYMPFEKAKSYLQDHVTAEDWEESSQDDASIIDEMHDYMEFAWGKANNCRGISASRSVDHYKIWLWILKDDLSEKLDDMYEYYGKPCLRAICEKYGWDWRKWDNDKWRNDEIGDSITADEAVA